MTPSVDFYFFSMHEWCKLLGSLVFGPSASQRDSHQCQPLLGVIEDVGLLLTLGQAAGLYDPGHHDLCMVWKVSRAKM